MRMKSTGDVGIIYVTTRMPEEMERAARIEAAKRDQNRSQFIIEAVQEKLDKIAKDRTE